MGGIGNVILKTYGYGKRAYNVLGVTLAGGGQKVLDDTFKAGMTTRNIFKSKFYTDVWQSTKTAGKNLEAYKAAEVSKNGSTWKTILNSLKNIPKDFKKGWTQGGIISAKKGNKFLMQLKGAFKKGFKGKSMVLGAALLALFELPNIIKATFNEGVVQGGAEVIKAAAKLGGSSLGAAIGQALIPIPILGSLVGGIIGYSLTGLVAGKSYSERKAEEQQKLQEKEKQQQEQMQQSTNPFAAQQQFMMMQQLMNNSTFNDDIMAKPYFDSLRQQTQPQ